jgi:PAS domain S-box-containing protein
VSRKRQALFLTALALFAGLVLVIDLLTPVGVEVWVMYLPVIIAPLWVNRARAVAAAATACSVLVCVGCLISPPGKNPLWWDVLNRGMGLMALWLTAYVGMVVCRRSTRLADVTTRLQREIADHRMTDLALRQGEERLRLAVEGAGMGTWDMDLRAGALVWSENHFRMLGYAPALGGHATSEMWLDRLHPEDRARVLEARDQALRDGTLYCPEYRVRRADTGATVWLAVFGRYVYDARGEAVRFLGVSFDITRRRELEREVREVAAREQRRIGQELHDSMGQELTGLGLMAQALCQRLGDGAERLIASRLAAGLDRVHGQARTLSRGLIPVQVETEGLAAALQDLAQSAGEQSGIPVRFDCAGGVERIDHARATQLFRIAQEAVTNALRHGRPRHVYLSLRSTPEWVRLGVRDDGVGARGRPDDGAGMGLRIMRDRAEQIGGVLQVGHADGGGTLVTCTLPRRSDHDGETRAPGGEPAADPDR